MWYFVIILIIIIVVCIFFVILFGKKSGGTEGDYDLIKDAINKDIKLINKIFVSDGVVKKHIIDKLDEILVNIRRSVETYKSVKDINNDNPLYTSLDKLFYFPRFLKISYKITMYDYEELFTDINKIVKELVIYTKQQLCKKYFKDTLTYFKTEGIVNNTIRNSFINIFDNLCTFDVIYNIIDYSLFTFYNDTLLTIEVYNKDKILIFIQKLKDINALNIVNADGVQIQTHKNKLIIIINNLNIYELCKFNNNYNKDKTNYIKNICNVINSINVQTRLNYNTELTTDNINKIIDIYDNIFLIGFNIDKVNEAYNAVHINILDYTQIFADDNNTLYGTEFKNRNDMVNIFYNTNDLTSNFYQYYENISENFDVTAPAVVDSNSIQAYIIHYYDYKHVDDNPHLSIVDKFKIIKSRKNTIYKYYNQNNEIKPKYISNADPDGVGINLDDANVEGSIGKFIEKIKVKHNGVPVQTNNNYWMIFTLLLEGLAEYDNTSPIEVYPRIKGQKRCQVEYINDKSTKKQIIGAKDFMNIQGVIQGDEKNIAITHKRFCEQFGFIYDKKYKDMELNNPIELGPNVTYYNNGIWMASITT